MISGRKFFMDRAAIKSVVVPDGNCISGDLFAELDLPMVVCCSGCLMTMTLFSACIDDDLRCWCSDCAGEEVEDDNNEQK